MEEVCQLDISLDCLGKGNLSGENVSVKLCCRQDCMGIFLVSDWCAQGVTAVHRDNATPGQGGLGCIRKQVEQAMGSKTESSTPSWPLL